MSAPQEGGRTISPDSAVQLGLVLAICSSLVTGTWMLRGIASHVDAHTTAIAELRRADQDSIAERHALANRMGRVETTYQHILDELRDLRADVKSVLGRRPTGGVSRAE